MVKLIINIAVIVILGLVGYKLATRPKVARVDFNSVSQENLAPVEACRAKQTCVIAYVAPWCGACHQFISQLPLVKERLTAKDVGLVFVVGAEDDMQKKVDFVDRLKPLAVLDSSGDGFRRGHKIDFFPSFIITDGDGAVIADPRTGRTKLMEMMN